MNLVNLSPVAFVAGLAALAGVLFLLQRLRVRYQPRQVVTLLFWKEALEEARARVLVRRFRHPLAYALALLIGGILLLGFADPRGGGDASEDHVILVDGSARLGFDAWGTQVREAARDRAGSLPDAQRRVMWCGSRIRPLLLPEEPIQMLDARWEDLAAEACPSSIGRAIDELVRTRNPAHTLIVHVAGAVPDPAMLALLPEGVRVEAISLPPAGTNRGITALGMSAAESGRWDRVDALVEVTGAGTVTLTREGRPVVPTRETSRLGRRQIHVSDLPADGGVLEARITGTDSLAADDHAAMGIPVRPLLRVNVSPSLRPILLPILEADPGVTLAESAAGADVAILRAGEADPGIPALVWVPPQRQPDAFFVQHEEDVLAEDVITDVLERLGLDEIDTTQLAQETGQVIRLSTAAGPGRRVQAWDTLLTPSFTFLGSRACPLFIALTLRWLAAVEEGPGFVAAGEPVRGARGVFAETGTDARPVAAIGGDLVPPAAGTWEGPGGPYVASLTDAATTTLAIRPSDVVVTPASASGTDGMTWIALFALGLLLVEWFLYRTGRMP
jgi:hypothetical protein